MRKKKTYLSLATESFKKLNFIGNFFKKTFNF